MYPTPPAITTDILNLCKDVVANPKPVLIRVTPLPNAKSLDCFQVVASHIEQHGGSVCYGWQIWETPGFMIEAEFHAVWRDPSGRLHDITPKQLPVTHILFVPDPVRKYDGRQINNVRRALRDDPRIKTFFELCDREFELLNQGDRAYQFGDIGETMSSSERDELRDIRERKHQLEMQFLEFVVPEIPEQPVRNMPRPGRNDPCPCGSGKKYKKCCLGNNKNQSVQSIPWPVYREELVMGNILEQSEQFRAFYEDERKKISGIVHWALDHNLPEEVNYRTTRSSTGQTVIRLKRIPAVLQDSMKIAHELEHLVLDAERFPIVAYRDDRFENISSALSSMITDIIVDTRLREYGFDLLDDYNRELSETKRQLAKHQAPPSDRLGRVHWILNYTSNLLDWEKVKTDKDKDMNDFHLWFEECYPGIAEEGKRLFSVVKQIGFDSKENAAHLFSEIIRLYNLGKYLLVTIPS